MTDLPNRLRDLATWLAKRDQHSDAKACRAAAEAIGTLPWREARYDQIFENGDQILTACVNPHNGAWWYAVVRIDCDEHYFKLVIDDDGDAELDWSDIRYWCPIRQPEAAREAAQGGEP